MGNLRSRLGSAGMSILIGILSGVFVVNLVESPFRMLLQEFLEKVLGWQVASLFLTLSGTLFLFFVLFSAALLASALTRRVLLGVIAACCAAFGMQVASFLVLVVLSLIERFPLPSFFPLYIIGMLPILAFAVPLGMVGAMVGGRLVASGRDAMQVEVVEMRKEE